MASLPYITEGEVIKGFGRGSKDLGCPTANLPQDVVDIMPKNLENGVYFGYAQLEGETKIFDMVMSIGYNPFYNNTKKSLECHLIYKFPEDFYGKKLRIIILGYLRAEKNFSSLDDLIEAIQDDIKQATNLLQTSKYTVYKNTEFQA